MLVKRFLSLTRASASASDATTTTTTTNEDEEDAGSFFIDHRKLNLAILLVTMYVRMYVRQPTLSAAERCLLSG